MILDQNPISVATCNSSRCVTVSGAREFYLDLLDILFTNPDLTLGQLVFEAKTQVISNYPGNDYFYGPAVLQTILGDPALRIKTLCSGINLNPGDNLPIEKFNLAYYPLEHNLHLQIPPGTRVNLRLADVTGRIIFNQQFNESGYINLNTLSPGTYLVNCYQISDSNKISTYFQFIKFD